MTKNNGSDDKGQMPKNNGSDDKGQMSNLWGPLPSHEPMVEEHSRNFDELDGETTVLQQGLAISPFSSAAQPPLSSEGELSGVNEVPESDGETKLVESRDFDLDGKTQFGASPLNADQGGEQASSSSDYPDDLPTIDLADFGMSPFSSEEASSTDTTSSSSDSSDYGELNSEVLTPRRSGRMDYMSAGLDASNDVAPSKIGDELASEKTTLLPLGKAAQSTLLLGSDGITSQGKLVVVSGNLSQEEYLLPRDALSIGRELDNDIVCSDPRVSRYNTKIHREGNRYVVEDLGSGNGTKLNSKKVKGKKTLAHGDHIQIGECVFRFVILDELMKEGEGKSISALVMGLSVALILGILLAGGLYLFKDQLFHDSKMTPEFVQKLIREGLIEYRQKNWLRAMTIFQTALKKDPENPEIKRLLHDTKSEAKVEALLKDGRRAFLLEDYKKAKKIFLKAEKALAPGSVYADEIWILLAKIKAKLRPKAPKVRVIARKLKGNQGRSRGKKRSFRGTKPTGVASKSNDSGMGSSVALADNTEPSANDDQGVEIFNSGRLKAAQEAFEQQGDQERASLIPKFSAAFRQGRAAHNFRNPNAAIPLLKKALKLDRKIGGGHSVFTAGIKTMLANMYASQGLRAKSQHFYAQALGFFQTALRYRPNHYLSKMQIKVIKKLMKKK